MHAKQALCSLQELKIPRNVQMNLFISKLSEAVYELVVCAGELNVFSTAESANKLGEGKVNHWFVLWSSGFVVLFSSGWWIRRDFKNGWRKTISRYSILMFKIP